MRMFGFKAHSMRWNPVEKMSWTGPHTHVGIVGSEFLLREAARLVERVIAQVIAVRASHVPVEEA